MRTVAFLWLLAILPARALAGTYYVDPNGTDDPNHGTLTFAGAWKTLTGAVTYVPDGTQTIKVTAATYNEAGTLDLGGVAANANNITFQSSDPNRVRYTVRPNNVNFGIYSNTATTAWTVTFKDMVLPSDPNGDPNRPAYLARLDSANTLNLENCVLGSATRAQRCISAGVSGPPTYNFTDCTFTQDPNCLAAAISSGVAAPITLTRCVATSVGQYGALLISASAPAVTVTDCTLAASKLSGTWGLITVSAGATLTALTATGTTFTTPEAAGRAIDIAGAITNLRGTGCTFTGGHGIRQESTVSGGTAMEFRNCAFHNSLSSVQSSKYWKVPQIENCTFDWVAPGTESYCIDLYQGSGGSNYMGRIILRNNTIIKTGTGNASDHACRLSHGVPVDISGNVFVDETAAPTGYWLVLKSTGGTVSHNVLAGKYAAYATSCSNVTFEHNTCYSNAANGFAFGLANDDATDPNDLPIQNVVRDNIFEGGLGAYAVSITGDLSDNNPIILDSVWSNIFDRNCYHGGTAALFHTQTASGTDDDTQVSLAEIQARWLALGGASAYNDATSIVADPQFLSLAGLDFRLRMTSPCRGTSRAQCYESLGAWQNSPVIQAPIWLGGNWP